MRDRLRKIAFLIAFFSLLPLVFFLSKKEEPPPDLKIETYNKQTVENFTLEEKKGDFTKWILKSPQAVFENDKTIVLYSPILTVKGRVDTIIKAQKAVYNKGKQIVEFDKPYLKKGEMVIVTKSGEYIDKNKIFKTDSFCKITLKTGYKIEGKGCIFNLQSEKLVIKEKVKTVIDGGNLEKNIKF